MSLKRNLIVWIWMLAASSALAQNSSTQANMPLRFINKIEIFAGPGLSFLNDNGWSDFIYELSDQRTIYSYHPKTGSIIGLSLIHSIKQRFELQGKFAFEKRRYDERTLELDTNGTLTSESLIAQKNNYLVGSVVASYSLSKSNRFHFFLGGSAYYLKKSLAIASYTTNGQPSGGASVNTIDGFEKYTFDALAGIGYLMPLNDILTGVLRLQGNYALSYSSNQNKQQLSINSISMTLALRYSQKKLKF